MPGPRGVGLRVLAGQLGHPRGPLGRVVGRMLNKANAKATTAATEALAARPGASLADLGFGGGVGLRLLLAQVGRDGRVYGVDQSTTMLAAAARRFSRQVAAGQLHLAHGSLDHLPLPDRSLDGAITLNTIYFLPDLPRACAQFARVLRPTGRIVVGLGDPVAMAANPLTRHGFRVRPVEEVIGALTAAGLPVIDHRRLGDGSRRFHLLVAAAAVPPS